MFILLIQFAGSVAFGGDESVVSYTAKDKFTRGASNVFYAPKEVPRQMANTSPDNPYRTWTEGLARGVGMAVTRAGTGVFEMATFYWDAPGNREPYLYPENLADQ
jgi:putative exosortase-associated protein (TIGR04073 family)